MICFFIQSSKRDVANNGVVFFFESTHFMSSTHLPTNILAYRASNGQVVILKIFNKLFITYKHIRDQLYIKNQLIAMVLPYG